jgi:hypothetical protein
MSKGKIITLVIALATILLVIAFIDACHETNDAPPGGGVSMLVPEAALEVYT